MKGHRSGGLRLALVCLAAAALALSASPPRATAQAVDATLATVATGLNNPRGLAFDVRGDLFIAEAGLGGPGPQCVPNPEGGEPACYGPTGSITRIRDGVQERVIEGLPSLAAPGGFAATGPHKLAFDASGGVVTIGLGADPAIRPVVPGLVQLGTLARISPNNRVRPAVDLAAVEGALDPDGEGADSNPYGVAIDGARRLATDAGGNALLVVVGAQTRALVTFPSRMVPFGGGAIPMQSVPTAVAVGPDGAYYVGELTGFPFPVGGARVYRVDRNTGATTIFAEGFTNIVDIAFDRQGRLLVLEIARNSLLSGDPTGRLVRVEGGAQTELASAGLVFPGGVAVSPGGAIYVSNGSIFPGGGSVVRVDE